jgi:RecB family endonuclease NucS
MDVLTLFRRTRAAATSLEGVLSVSKMQNYQRLDAKTAEMSLTILMREDETAEMLWKEMDAVIEGYSELRAEIATRQAAAKG